MILNLVLQQLAVIDSSQSLLHPFQSLQQMFAGQDGQKDTLLQLMRFTAEI